MNKKDTYKAYIYSPVWEKKKAMYWKMYGKSCKVCGSRLNLHVHHKNYIRFGREWMTDLLGVCKGCHMAIHKFHRKRGGPLDRATDIYVYLYKKDKKTLTKRL